LGRGGHKSLYPRLDEFRAARRVCYQRSRCGHGGARWLRIATTRNVSPFLATASSTTRSSRVEGHRSGTTPRRALTEWFTLPTDGSLTHGRRNTNFNLFSVSQNFKTTYLYNYTSCAEIWVERRLPRSAMLEAWVALLLCETLSGGWAAIVYPPGTPTRPAYYSQFHRSV